MGGEGGAVVPEVSAAGEATVECHMCEIGQFMAPVAPARGGTTTVVATQRFGFQRRPWRRAFVIGV